MENKRSAPAFRWTYYHPVYWSTWLALAFFYLIARLPVPVGLAIGKLIGKLFVFLAPSRRRISATNIALCFPELSAAKQREMLHGVMRSCGISLMESAMALWGAADKFRSRHSIIGLEHLQQAQAQGQGVLLVGCHFTTLDAAARILAFYTHYDLLYRKDPNPLLAYQLTKARKRFIGSAIVRNDTRQLIKNLRQGHVVWYAPDQDYGIKQSIFAPFFGIEAATVTATGKVAKLGQAAVLPFAHYRDNHGHYQLIIHPALDNYPSGDELADATRINRIFEDAIRQHPDQYLWVHRRFKTRPLGQPSFYKR